ncbi:MAG: 30S ribosomal protein S8 [Patescibacteria group bacterium]
MYINLLIKIKNAMTAKKTVLKTRYSKMDYAVAEILKARGFLTHVEIKGRAPKKIIEIALNLEHPIQGLRFLSKPSRKLYGGYDDFKKVKGGYGFLVVSTPKGVMPGDAAKKERVGGQLLFEIW